VGFTGNAQGIGAYCTATGQQCAGGTLCAADFTPGEDVCIQLGCSSDASCGEGACCVSQDGQQACVPALCVGSGPCPD
jgi:hypothetical protein